MMREPRVRILAQELDACLREAQALHAPWTAAAPRHVYARKARISPVSSVKRLDVAIRRRSFEHPGDRLALAEPDLEADERPSGRRLRIGA